MIDEADSSCGVLVHVGEKRGYGDALRMSVARARGARSSAILDIEVWGQGRSPTAYSHAN